MKKRSDATEKQSRRTFAKSITTALVTAPLTSLMVSAQNRRQRRPKSMARKQQVPNTETLSHLPPITIKDGSLIIESDEQFDRIGAGSHLTRPHKYKRRKKDNEPSDPNIRCVIVMKGNRQVLRQKFAPGECEIKIYWDESECDH